MARIPWLGCGWESGDINEDGGSTTIPSYGAMAVATATPSPRSGSYCLKAAATGYGANQGAYRRLNLGSNCTEHYGRIPLYLGYGTSVAHQFVFWRALDDGSVSHLYLTAQDDLTVKLYRGAVNTGTLLASSGVGAIPENQWNLLEYRCKIDDAAGVFQLWINGTLVIDFSGDTRNAGNANIRFVDLACLVHTANGSSQGLYHGFDDVAFNDTTGSYQTGQVGDGAVLLLKPSGNGASSQLTGSDGNQVDNYALVDEVPPTTADYVASSTADQYDTYALENVPSPYNAVNLVQPIAYAALAAAGTGALKLVLRSGGADYDDSSDKSLGTAYQFIRGDVRYVDPADSNSWTTTKVNALEAGPKVR